MNRSRKKRALGVEELCRRVESGQRAPFYLLYGEEDFEREGAGVWLREKLAPETAPEFNVDLFYGDQFTPEDFLQAYYSYPIMAGHRLVVLKSCEKIPADISKKLEAIFSAPSDTSALLVLGEKADLRRTFFQQLSRRGWAVEFRPPYPNQLPRWIQRRARRLGLRLEAGVAERLALYIGANLRELVGEMDKLATFVGLQRPIAVRDVEAVVGWRHASIFSLTDAIGRAEYRQAQILLRQLLNTGEEPGHLLAMIQRHFQLLLRAQDLQSQHLPREDMARRLGISSFFLQDYLDQARRYSRDTLWSGMGSLLEIDAQLKRQGRRQQGASMDVLLHCLSLCTAG